MSKLKTHKGAAKRFKKTASGFKRNQSHRRHLLTQKSTKRKRQLRAGMMICKSDTAAVKQMLPNV